MLLIVLMRKLVEQSLSQGVDGIVKTIYSPRPSLLRALHSKGRIVKPAYTVIAARPVQGPVAHACVRAMRSFVMLSTNALPTSPSSPVGFDRSVGHAYPGEEAA